MTIRFTQQGCKVETTFVPQPNGALAEHIVLSVDPASSLALSVAERAGQPIPQPVLPRGSSRVRSTRFGFELIPERGR
jgi:hypothetical protein